MNDVSVTTNDTDVSMELKSATDSAIENWAKNNLDSKIDARTQETSKTISLTSLGLRPGQNISEKLNQAIRDAGPGTVFFVPPVVFNSSTPAWRVDSPIHLKSGISIVGSGRRRRGPADEVGGSWLYRTGDFPVFSAIGADPDPKEDASNLMVANFRLEGLCIHGKDIAGDLLVFRNVGAMIMKDCFTLGTFGSCMKIDGQFQDSLFFNNRWEWGGTADGLVPMVEIDNSTVVGRGCSNNIVFINDTMESYRGTALKIHGAAGKGYLPTHWCSFTNMKIESVLGDAAHIVMDRCSGIEMGLRTFFGMGNRGPGGKPNDPPKKIPCLISMTNCWGMDLKANFGIGASGCDVESVVDMTGSRRCNVSLRMSDMMVPRKIYGPSFVKMDKTEGNIVQVDYLGGHSWGSLTAPVKKLTAPETQPVEINTTNSTVTAAGGFRFNEDGVGSYVGQGDPKHVFPEAPVGSVYHRTDGQPGQAFYVKEGSGPQGWVAK